MKLRRTVAGEEDFQMAPMIDMVFLLLVFFMTVSTLAQDERVPMELPESDRSQVADDLTGRVTISLLYGDHDEVIRHFGPRAVSLTELQERLREDLRVYPELAINLRATPDMPFAEIRKVLQACAEVGAHRIIYATYQSD